MKMRLLRPGKLRLLMGVTDGGSLEARVRRLIDARLPWSRRWRVVSAVACMTVLAAASLGLGMLGVRASLAQGEEGKPIRFDVVSIRPSKPGATVYDGGGFGVTEDGFYSKILPLSMVLKLAYFPALDRTFVMKNTPPWAVKENYDVVAKVAPEDVAAWRKMKTKDYMTQNNGILQQALRAMLEERMKVVAHTEPIMVDGYALVVSKHGLKMATASPNDNEPEKGMKLNGGGKAVFTGPDRKTAQWTFYNASMDDLRGFIASGLGTQLLDETGMKGKYHFVLNLREIDPGETPNRDDPPRWDLDALGLQLKPVKVKSENVVIDHIERPSEN